MYITLVMLSVCLLLISSKTRKFFRLLLAVPQALGLLYIHKDYVLCRDEISGDRYITYITIEPEIPYFLSISISVEALI